MRMRFLPIAALALGLAAPALSQGFTPEQRAEVLSILRDALRSDPSILRDALAGLEEAEQRDRAEARRAAIAANAEALFRDAADPVKGNPRGDVTLVEFFDARCGYCKQLHPTMEALLRRDPNVRVVMKDLPILGPNSVLAARALLAAQRQGRYGPLYDALLTLRVEPTEAVIRQQAERAGLDWTRLRRDMDDPAVERRIQSNLRLAGALGIEGTPALVIGETLVPGAVELPALERLVAEARAARR
jgi:protein-disulfide isomerase